MDSSKPKAKYFDVTPPASGQKTGPSIVQAKKHVMITDEPTSGEASSGNNNDALLSEPVQNVQNKGMTIEAPADLVAAEPQTVKRETVITPPADLKADTAPDSTDEVAAEPKPQLDAPAVDPLPESSPSEKSDSQPAAEETPEDKDVAVPDIYAVNDALPDTSTLDANAEKDTMQDPKLYDTNAYHVPIKDTHHAHGGVKAAFIFGAVCAIGTVGAAVYIMVKMGS